MNSMANLLYVLPLLIAVTLMIYYVMRKEIKYKKALRKLLQKDGKQNYINKIVRKLIPVDSKICRFYSSKICKYSRLSMDTMLKIKIVLFISAIIFLALVKYTNVLVQTQEIFTRYDYKTDLIYKIPDVIDKSKALEQEISCFKKALKALTKKDIVNMAGLQQKIINLINRKDFELIIPKETMANKIYYRLTDYYQVRRINILLFVSTGLLVSFIPELYLIIKNAFCRADAKRELRFLKKLIIINGSIKPVDFRKILRILIEKSKYYKNILEEIEESNRKNYTDNRKIYIEKIKTTNDINEKLFFEKLDEANNYNFEQAVKNIKNEFKLERRDIERKTRKRIEFIHVSGLLGAMIIIVLMILYLILPWMKLYNMSQIGL